MAQIRIFDNKRAKQWAENNFLFIFYFQNTGTLFCLTNQVTTSLRLCCVMAGSMTLTAIFTILTVSLGPCVFIQCTEVTCRFICTTFKEGAGHVCLWLTDVSHLTDTLLNAHQSFVS
jgi:hypothetical protein